MSGTKIQPQKRKDTKKANDKCQSSKFKSISKLKTANCLTFGHLKFVWHLDFEL
jgi:hypothetical protein